MEAIDTKEKGYVFPPLDMLDDYAVASNKLSPIVPQKFLLDDACFKENKFELHIVVGRSTDDKVKVFDVIRENLHIITFNCSHNIRFNSVQR